MKLASAKADKGIDLSNAIFLALVLAEETMAFFLHPGHVMFLGIRKSEHFWMYHGT